MNDDGLGFFRGILNALAIELILAGIIIILFFILGGK